MFTLSTQRSGPQPGEGGAGPTSFWAKGKKIFTLALQHANYLHNFVKKKKNSPLFQTWPPSREKIQIILNSVSLRGKG